jgi:hypothetical protein
MRLLHKVTDKLATGQTNKAVTKAPIGCKIPQITMSQKNNLINRKSRNLLLYPLKIKLFENNEFYIIYFYF